MRLPDFIIGGVQKCGTTTLHHILAQHPDIDIPDREVHFFDADDPATHDDLQSFDEPFPSIENYAAFFKPYDNARLVGEDSTTYLSSSVSAARIKSVIPNAKMIFILRNPVDRAYSHYWHKVKTGRTTSRTFEHALSADPQLVVNSTYAPNLRVFVDLFETKVLLFEDMVRDMQSVADEVFSFLGLPTYKVGPMHSNRTVYPVNSIPFILNIAGKRLAKYRDSGHFDGKRGLLSAIDRKWNTLTRATMRPGSAPAINPVTRARLLQHFEMRNVGLSDLIGKEPGWV